MDGLRTDVPVLLLGGQRNTLAVARNLGKNGVRVSVSGRPTCWGLYSKYCAERHIIPDDVVAEESWRLLLLGESAPTAAGTIVFAMNDDALQFLTAHCSVLRTRYALGDFQPDLYRALLDKVETIKLARSAGVPTPEYWIADNMATVHETARLVVFPVLIKPFLTHEFARMFGAKLFIVHSEDELVSKAQSVLTRNIPFMIAEMIPGPDSNLKGYYTYITGSGERLFEYTHSVIRRQPPGWGSGCCHHAVVLPEVIEAGRKFLDGIGFRGFANVEFKVDDNDGKLKVIEVNTRFTAPHQLMVRSGMPLDLMVYCHLTGQSVPRCQQVDGNFGSWLPLVDFMAFLELRNRGELTLKNWLRDVFSRRPVLNVFSWSDPGPIYKIVTLTLKKRFQRALHSAWSR